MEGWVGLRDLRQTEQDWLTSIRKVDGKLEEPAARRLLSRMKQSRRLVRPYSEIREVILLLI